MKRPDLWLTLVLGATAGLLAGFFLGQTLSSPGPHPGGAPSPAGKLSGARGPSDPAGSSTENTAATREWLSLIAARFSQQSPDGTTPGLAETMAEVLHLEDNSYRQARLVMLIGLMRKEDFPIALDILRKAKLNFSAGSVGKNGPDLWLEFWQRFGRLDPDQALKAALQASDLQYPGRDQLEKWLFRGMALADPELAARAFIEHPELPNRAGIVSGLFGPFIARDSKAALAWARQNLDPEELHSAYFTAAWGLSGPNDISRATAVLKETEDPDLKNALVSQLRAQVNTKAYLPTAQVLDFVATCRAVGTRDPALEQRIAVRCAETDAFAAATLFATPLPEGTPNDFAPLRAVMAPWIRRDPKAAEAWTKGQTNSPAYPIAAEEFAAAAQERNDPAEAERWLKLAGK
jgi:hypothetical protein